MQLPHRARAATRDQAQLCADSRRVSVRAFQPDAQARSGGRIAKQAGLVPILRNDEIGPAISVKVRRGGATLLAVNQEAAFLAGHRGEITAPRSTQEQTAPRVGA